MVNLSEYDKEQIRKQQELEAHLAIGRAQDERLKTLRTSLAKLIWELSREYEENHAEFFKMNFASEYQEGFDSGWLRGFETALKEIRKWAKENLGKEK